MRLKHWLLWTCGVAAAFAHTGLYQRIAAVAANAGAFGRGLFASGKQLNCNFNVDAKLPMQSVYKLPIAMATLSAFELGRLTLQGTVGFLNIASCGRRK